jgi:hypothetical protein
VSHVIDFLERLGEDAHLRHAQGDELARALAEAGVDVHAGALILRDDRRALRDLLGAMPDMVCGIAVPQDDDDKEDEDEEEEDDGDDSKEAV